MRAAARPARLQALEPGGSKWHIHGWFCMAGCVLLMMYYTTVSGWMVDYFFRFLTGSFDGLTSEQAAGVFWRDALEPVEMVFWMSSSRWRALSSAGAACRAVWKRSANG